MATVTLTRKRARTFGPHSAGTLMTPREFDRAEFVEGNRYELIHGVLVVSPTPLENERDPNEELGHWLRTYKEFHPLGASLDATLPEHLVRMQRNRRRADRAIWTGLGHLPRKKDTPTILIEFVSAGKKDRLRDYEEKREEYMEIGVIQYWVIDRFARTLTFFFLQENKIRKRVFRENKIVKAELLPGFEFPLARLLAFADRWPEEDPESP